MTTFRKILLGFIWCLAVLISCHKQTPAAAQPPASDSTGTGNDPGDNTGDDPPQGGVTGAFLYGSNMGYYPGWTDPQLAEILIGSSHAAGAGVNSLRPAMYDHFVSQWGYNIRVDAFRTYSQLGARDNVIFLNGPSEAHRDKTIYCNGHQSMTFANLYEPIWKQDGQINTQNYYADYVYQVVKTYGPYVKYWEVWNEPDFTNNWNATLTWGDKDPDPCDLTGFYAPVQSYIRMLRITHEVVKKLDPEDLVCLGGIGYESFLEAILRNSDNPAGGAVTEAYPQKGGAWFDCVSFHIYPMYSLGNNRNSDLAAQTISEHRNLMESVLARYQYEGKKRYLVTECNIPRKAIDGFIGSDEAQRNFMIKAAVAAQKSGILGLYIYGAAESTTPAAATTAYDMMGLYQKLPGSPYQATINSSGISWRTTSRLLKGRYYDKAQTGAMKMPAGVDGAAFYDPIQKNYVYVLWAKATGNSESATASYSFPASFAINSATRFSWDEKSSSVQESISLSAAPVFIKP